MLIYCTIRKWSSAPSDDASPLSTSCASSTRPIAASRASSARCCAALGVVKVGRQRGGARHMQPVQFRPNAYPNLVGVGDAGDDERVADSLLQGLEPHARERDRTVHAARRAGDAADLR